MLLENATIGWGRGAPMSLQVHRVELREIERLRDVYRHEMNCQIIHDSIHVRPGWTEEYLITEGGAKCGVRSDYPRMLLNCS